MKGTIPVNENGFGISGAFASGARQFTAELADKMLTAAIAGAAPEISIAMAIGTVAGDYTVIHTETSPPLDSLIYWFNKKSINLYGEALLKTMAYRKKGYGITDTGVTVLKDFWNQNGIDAAELNIVDGSGLSLNWLPHTARCRCCNMPGNKAGSMLFIIPFRYTMA